MQQGNWDDDKLDRLARKVDDGFARIDHQFALVDQRFIGIELQLKEVDRRLDRFETRVETGFQDMNARFDRMQQTLLITNGGIIAVVLAAILS